MTTTDELRLQVAVLQLEPAPPERLLIATDDLARVLTELDQALVGLYEARGMARLYAALWIVAENDLRAARG